MGKVGVDTLASRITNVIDIHRKAEDVTNTEVIGVLELIKMDLHREMIEDEDEDAEEWKGTDNEK